MNAVDVSIGTGNNTGLIYNSDTPQAMVTNGQYRIPPREWTKFWVELDSPPASLGTKVLHVFVVNQGIFTGLTSLDTPNGQDIALTQADFTGPNSTAVPGSTVARYLFEKITGSIINTPTATGVGQTQPGSAGQLVLVVANKAAAIPRYDNQDTHPI